MTAESGPLQRVLQKAVKAKRSGKGWTVRCPAHEDRNASLSIGAGDNGSALLKCFAGCTVEEIVAAWGLTMKDLWPADQRSRAGNGSVPVEAIYDYTDENGELLSQVMRKVGKQWGQRRPDGKGGHVYDLVGVRRVLYRLPELIEAIGLRKRVYVVEGEKDVDRLRALGFAATTNAGGAGKWRDEYAAHLKGANVVVMPDNDDVGRKHAAQVAKSLLSIGAIVRILALSGLPPKGDVSDWLNDGHTTEELDALADACAPMELRERDDIRRDDDPAVTAIEPDTEADGFPRAVCALSAPDAAPITWLVDGLITAGEFGLLVGDDGAMKTTLALHIAGAVAGGYPVFGKFATRQRAVLFVSEEDSLGVLVNRLEAMVRGHGWSRDAVFQHVHFLAMQEVRVTDAGWRAHLLSEIRRLDVGLVVFDPLAEVANGNEDSNSERRDLIQAFRAMTKPTSANVLALHHLGKAVPDKRRRDRIRGASAVPAASRFTYVLEKKDDGVGVECLKLSRGARPSPFVVRHTIESDPDNPAVWTLARFEYVTVREATLDAAEEFIMSRLNDGERLNTSDLKKAAQGTGVSGADIARALKALAARNAIDYEEGDKNAKLWGRVCLPDVSGQAGNQENVVAGQAGRLPGKQPNADLCLPAPFRGQAGKHVARVGAVVVNGGVA